MITCNTRVLTSELTGVQRYTLELLARFNGNIETVKPDMPLNGIKGHVWEQFILPAKIKGKLLWSPSNTGPLTVKKQVVSIMDLSPMDHPEWMGKQFSAWYGFLTPRLVKQVCGVLTLSEFSKQRIIHYCPDAESKIHVVHLAADKRFAPSDMSEIPKMLEHLSIPTPHYLVALGSLEPRKNLGRLLQAWKNIVSKVPDDVWLVLAGAQGKKLVFGDQSFEKLPPRVHLTGHVPDELLPTLYSGAIGSVYVSLYEGFGLPPLEAMSCGTAVLASNLTSLPEVVGDAALTVNPYDVDAISDGLMRLINDSILRKNLQNKGLKQAKKFSWDKTAEQTLEVLTQAARS
ncbi:glycosyltransferase family 4 protein [Polaromonas sp.]|uniref:glycosyltransferase family 4 protein n=1 Tax=Polaromonas sp. TaxID=1869339 RepID=UPI003BB52869